MIVISEIESRRRDATALAARDPGKPICPFGLGPQFPLRSWDTAIWKACSPRFAGHPYLLSPTPFRDSNPEFQAKSLSETVHPGPNRAPRSTSKSCLKIPVFWQSTSPADCHPPRR
jgi:hypothetical protein